ncbi:hypothetical protein [Paenibacillus germinis]|uniref:hypothetical protein n=1 Tax=Paenibacillus germinis TaxID=2654979 RepID=UPI001FE81375
MDQWNERFGSNEYVYGEQPNAFIKDQAHRLKGKQIVAFAEGEGRGCFWQGRDIR